ncbi:MAG: NAD-dependent epimerase/dehydratase family protein [Bacteroidetes bacterium]|nr:NAD-dependent epimerase/dehydratase family protein [Bacteroidota bacterium]
MNIVITGSNGFIGKNLLNQLLEKYPEAKFKCLVRAEKKSDNPRVEFVTVNYLDLQSILDSKVVDDADYIFHVAGVTKSATKKRFWEGNVIPTQNLLEAVKQTGAKLKRFLLVSSQAASGPSDSLDHLLSESEDANPVELYGASKYEAEKILRTYSDIPFTIISPGGVFGPGDVDFLKIFEMTKMGINVYAGVNGKYMSVIFSEDLVNAIVASAFSENCINKKYFIVNDKPNTWNEIHETVFEVAGKKRFDISLPFPLLNVLSYLGSAYSVISNNHIIFNKNKVSMSGPKYWIASNAAAKKDFGFEPKYNLKEAMQKTYDWYKENKWL